MNDLENAEIQNNPNTGGIIKEANSHELLSTIALISTVFKNGIIPSILGFEILYQKLNSEEIQKDLKIYGLDIEIFEKAQKSLNYTFIISLMICFLSISFFLILRKNYSKVKIYDLSNFYSNILFLFTIDSIVNGFFNLFKIKTGNDLIDSLFSFKNQDFISSMYNYLFLYLPKIQTLNLALIFVFIRGIIEIIYILIQNSIIYDDQRGLKLKSLPVFKTKLISDAAFKSISDICKRIGVDENSILIPFSKKSKNLKELIKFENCIFVPKTILENFKEEGLKGKFLIFAESLEKGIHSRLMFIALLLNFGILLILYKLVKISYKSKKPTLNIMNSIKIIDSLGFISILLVNFLQRSYEFEIDQSLKKQGFKNAISEYFVQRSKTKTIENAHFSRILSLISSFNSIVSRLKKLELNS